MRLRILYSADLDVFSRRSPIEGKIFFYRGNSPIQHELRGRGYDHTLLIELE